MAYKFNKENFGLYCDEELMFKQCKVDSIRKKLKTFKIHNFNLDVTWLKIEFSWHHIKFWIIETW